MIPALELGELEAMRDLFAAGGGRTTEIAGALCTSIAELPKSAMFNRVMGLGLSEPATEQALDEIDGFFRDAGVDYGYALHPLARPRELRLWLEERRFHTGYAWTKFERGVEAPPEAESELRVEEVGPDRAGDFAEVFVRAYGTPELFREWAAQLPGRAGWHCFVAYDGGTAAATGAVFVHGDVGWFGLAGTLPELRRRGAQNGILAARIRAAADAGATVLVTETGERVEGKPSNSYRNIERAGFEFRYVRPNYLSSPEADTSGTA